MSSFISHFNALGNQTLQWYQFIDSIDDTVTRIFEDRPPTVKSDRIIGFTYGAVSKMSLYWKLLFLKHVTEDQADESNPREVFPRHINSIKRILSTIHGPLEQYMTEREVQHPRAFPLWKAEVARKGVLQTLIAHLKEMKALTLETIMKMLDISLKQAKDYAKKLQSERIAIIKDWNASEPTKTLLRLHPSMS